MVAGVYSNDGSLQLEATTQFRKLLSIERSPPIEEVIKSGVVPHFVEFLMREDFHNFSAHGVPVSYVENVGDPYRDQMEECIRLIMNELKSIGITNQHTLAYQSRVGPAQWLKSYTDEVLVEHVQKGVKSLLAVPVSFMSEHIETLLEINMEYKELALESGIENWGRVPALGCTSSYIYDLADAVVEALPSSSVTSKTKRDLTESDIDHLLYGVILFFGSFLAFVLLLSPTLISAFRNYLI